MTSAAKKILEEALALPEDERRQIAEELLASVPSDSAETVARDWDREVGRRIDSAEKSGAAAAEWPEAAAKLRAKYAGQ